MSDFVRSVRIDGSAFGASRSAGSQFSSPGLDSMSPWNGGITGISPARSFLHDSPSDGTRRYRGPLGVAFDEHSAAAVAERRQLVAEEEERRFVSRVRNVLHEIGSKRSGRAVLAELGRRPRQVTITPYLPTDYEWRNGTTRASDGNWKDATRKHWLLRDYDGEPMRDKNGDRTRGTGAGADAIIEFITPDLMRLLINELAVTLKWSAGGESHSLAFADEILVHELVHAIRIVAGLSVDRRVPRQPRYGTMEEFFAIVVTNVYRSECGRDGVRNANHGAWETMSVSGEHFLKLQFNRAHLRQLRRQHPQLVQDLREVDTYFNPFRYMRPRPGS